MVYCKKRGILIFLYFLNIPRIALNKEQKRESLILAILLWKRLKYEMRVFCKKSCISEACHPSFYLYFIVSRLNLIDAHVPDLVIKFNLLPAADQSSNSQEGLDFNVLLRVGGYYSKGIFCWAQRYHRFKLKAEMVEESRRKKSLKFYF